jgi:hypothetical protein
MDFGRILSLLSSTDLLVNGAVHRFAELEAYYHGPGHLDPFTHCDPLQRENGRWYFHRSRGQYRGGSFKGLDLTFGDGTAYFGVLIRSIVAPSGAVIAGPSLAVDHLLAQTQVQSVGALDASIGGRSVWDASSPLAIRETLPRSVPVYASARVGLSLKRVPIAPEAPAFIGRPYRWLTAPRSIAKGKPHLVLALHQAREGAATIRDLTGCPRNAIDRYIAHYEEGKAATGFERYVGKDLSTAELCRLLGAWEAVYAPFLPEQMPPSISSRL